MADHMPMAGAVKPLSASFGIRLLDGFVFEQNALNSEGTLDDFDRGGWITFCRGADGLATHPVTEGRQDSERIEHLTTDTGSAFRLPVNFVSLITLGAGSISVMPDTAWALHRENRRDDVAGWSQAAVGCVGAGRVALLGDAWLFMPEATFDDAEQEVAARYHPRFTANLINWTAGRLPCS